MDKHLKVKSKQLLTQKIKVQPLWRRQQIYGNLEGLKQLVRRLEMKVSDRSEPGGLSFGPNWRVLAESHVKQTLELPEAERSFAENNKISLQSRRFGPGPDPAEAQWEEPKHL